MPQLAPSLIQLRDEINRRWPNRGKASDGWIGDPAHAARTSDHNPDQHGIVRAIDVDEDLTGGDTDAGAEARVIVEHLRASRDARIKYVIYEGRLFSSYATGSRRPWEWGPYSGPNQHRRHLHISILPSFAASANTTGWGIASATPPVTVPTPPKEFDEMATKEEIREVLREELRELFTDEPGTSKGFALGQIVKRLTRELDAPSSLFRQALSRVIRVSVRGEAPSPEPAETPDPE